MRFLVVPFLVQYPCLFRAKKTPKFPKKLRALAPASNLNGLANVDNTYYETGSSCSSSSDDEDEEPKAAPSNAYNRPLGMSSIKGANISVARLEETEKARNELPILAEEQQIVETINENTVRILLDNI